MTKSLVLSCALALAVFASLPQISFAAQPPAGTTPVDTSQLSYKQFRWLPIQNNGRIKPIDTFAIETLVSITGYLAYTDKSGHVWQPKDFLLSAFLKTYDWPNEPMVLVSFGKLKQQLGLERSQSRFSFARLAASSELQRLAAEARTQHQANKPVDRLHEEALNVSERLALFTRVMDGTAWMIVPAPKNATDAWVSPSNSAKYYTEAEFSAARQQWEALATTYIQAEPVGFNRAARLLRLELRRLNPGIYPPDSQMDLEWIYNHFEGFYRSAWLYGIAFIFLLIAQLRRRGHALPNIGVAVATLGLFVHVAGIALRCIIASRSPVMNTFESIVWVAFVVALLGLLFFARYRSPIYLLAPLAFTIAVLLLVHDAPIAISPNIDPLSPVLRDNFWLTTHSLISVSSYAFFAVAMAFGHVLLWKHLRRPAAAETESPMHRCLYRMLQVGLLFLAAGTILGAIWAHYAWHRFWGWDPKETFTLAVLLCYSVALVGCLTRWWAGFALAVTGVVCFLAILTLWFGINFFAGTSLHTFGFGPGGQTFLVEFTVLDLGFVGAAAWRHRSVRRSVTSSQSITNETVAAR